MLPGSTVERCGTRVPLKPLLAPVVGQAKTERVMQTHAARLPLHVAAGRRPARATQHAVHERAPTTEERGNSHAVTNGGQGMQASGTCHRRLADEVGYASHSGVDDRARVWHLRAVQNSSRDSAKARFCDPKKNHSNGLWRGSCDYPGGR